MHEYRVTIETLDEAYEYIVDADTREDASEEGCALAIWDGMDQTRYHWVNVESLS